jgi:diacylglycerol kinase (ATP)
MYYDDGNSMKQYSPGGWKRLYAAGCNSWQGLRHLLGHEAAFIQECWLCLVLLPVILWLEVTTVERLLLLGSLFGVLIVEVLNSAIEAVVDRVGEEYHVLSGLAKDLGSLAVSLSLCFAIIVWLVILVT